MNENVLYKKIIGPKSLLNIIINEIYYNNLTRYVEKIEIGNSVPIARYYYQTKKLCFNYENIVSAVLKKAKNFNFKNDKELIDYINMNIISIILHEISHVYQEKNKNNLIILSEQEEKKQKRKGTYTLCKYLTNPIERQAQINALSRTIELKKSQEQMPIYLLKIELLDIINYGYYKGNYPMSTFFKGTGKLEQATELAQEIQEFNQKVEYGCKLTSIELKLVKELNI